MKGVSDADFRFPERIYVVTYDLKRLIEDWRFLNFLNYILIFVAQTRCKTVTLIDIET
jgi:hypothetical protein